MSDSDKKVFLEKEKAALEKAILDYAALEHGFISIPAHHFQKGAEWGLERAYKISRKEIIDLRRKATTFVLEAQDRKNENARLLKILNQLHDNALKTNNVHTAEWISNQLKGIK